MLSSNVKYIGLDVHKEEFDPHKVGSDQCIASLKSAQTVDVDCVEVPPRSRLRDDFQKQQSKSPMALARCLPPFHLFPSLLALPAAASHRSSYVLRNLGQEQTSRVHALYEAFQNRMTDPETGSFLLHLTKQARCATQLLSRDASKVVEKRFQTAQLALHGEWQRWYQVGVRGHI